MWRVFYIPVALGRVMLDSFFLLAIFVSTILLWVTLHICGGPVIDAGGVGIVDRRRKNLSKNGGEC